MKLLKNNIKKKYKYIFFFFTDSFLGKERIVRDSG